MARGKPRDYFEPWKANADTGFALAYRREPTHGDTPEEVAQNKADWIAARDRAEKDAAWWVYGSDIHPPAVMANLMGGTQVHSGAAILARFNRVPSPPDNAPTQGDMARRACECVNGCRGIVDPQRFMEEVKGLLMDLAKGDTSGDDIRVVSLLGRCVPLEEIGSRTGANEQWDN